MADARLYTKYKNDIAVSLQDQFDYENKMAVPKLEKVVINVGVGEAIENEKMLDTACDNVALISGQRPIKTRAKKSISNFKLRQGMPIGCKVTLRKKRMYEFIDRLINLALPRSRDFQGIPDTSFDGRGNYSFGIKDHTVFPEIRSDQAENIHGLDVTFVTSTENDQEAYALLKQLGMPFVKRDNS